MADPGLCETCAAFYAVRQDATLGKIGECALQPERALAQRGDGVQVRHARQRGWSTMNASTSFRPALSFGSFFR